MDGNTTAGKLHHSQHKWRRTGIVCIGFPAKRLNGVVDLVRGTRKCAILYEIDGGVGDLTWLVLDCIPDADQQGDGWMTDGRMDHGAWMARSK